ncbi:glycosyltransferase family 4 protein [Microbacterium marmarense]|uniref:Glycosyltransferase family 4 protein n=1 Tax=Microbacterium marmarense TaxID=3122051 RepID=A0ABU8LVS8_9MICO
MSHSPNRAISATFIHSSNEMYGADRMLLRVLSALRHETSATVWLPDDAPATEHKLSNELASERIEHEEHRLPIIRRANLTLLGAMRLARDTIAMSRVFRQNKPDVVWCATSAALPAALAARFAGVDKIVLHNQEVWRPREASILGLFAIPVDRIVSISDAVHNSLPANARRKSIVIPNSSDDVAQVSLPADIAVTRFLMASRWNGWKGHETLLRAWAMAKEPGVLVIAGSAPQSGTAVNVPELVESLGIGASVEIIGEVADLHDEIRRAHYVVMPSDQPEPFGLVAIEALSEGRPVVASAGGGLGRIIVDGECGHLFPNRDVSALARVLARTSVAESLRMSAAARARYMSNYSREAFEQSLRAEWERLIAE